MESSREITKLCESWWEKLADSTKVDQHRYAERLLGLLGWRNAGPIEPRPAPAQLAAITYLLRGSGRDALAAHFVMPGTLEPPSSLVKRGLDLCEATRLLVDETRALHANYAFVSDLYRSYLYDARTDELLLHADTPEQFRREFTGVLTREDLERGSLEEIRRQPRSYAARQLREWCHHWCETIVAETRLTEEYGALVIDRLLVLRYLFDHDILKRTGWRLRWRFTELAAKAFGPDPRGCGKQLTGLFHDIWFDWKADLFAAEPALDAVLERDEIAAPLLKEFGLHSGVKFTIPTILESFNYGEAAEKARVRMVPDANEDRELYFAQQTPATIDTLHLELDLTDEGYRAIFHWFDRLVALYERLETEFDTQALADSGRSSEEMDLFVWSEIAAQRPQALADKIQHAIEHGLTIYCSTPRQLRTARLMLYLYVISRYDQTKQRFTHFPRMDHIFKKRPPILETGRKWIYQPPPSDNEDWDV